MSAKNLPSQLWQLSAAQTAALVRSGDLSAREVAEAALARVDAVNPEVNAIVELRAQEILDQAKKVDEDRAQGRPLGILAGVPVAIKVNVDQIGYATTNGVSAQKDLVATENAPMVQGLIDSGAVLFGRTNAPAFSTRWFTNNKLHGATFNPHNKALTPGGSSGGAASAIAAGMVPMAHGSDIAGSIRYPAYACGIHGLRPTVGRVPAFNATLKGERTIGGQIMAVSGPLARTVQDLRLGLHAMARPDARDPWYVPAPLVGEPMPRRAAVCLRPDGMDTAPEICEALLASAAKLRDAGWVVDEVDSLPPIEEAVRVQMTLWLGDGYDAQLAAAEREGDAGALAVLKGQQDLARSISLQDLSGALAKRSAIVRAWQVYFHQQYSVVLLPESAELPFEDNLDLKDAASYERMWKAQGPQIGLAVAAMPGLALATGLVRGNTPVGIQILAARYREDVCLEAAEAIEARSPALLFAMAG